MQKFHSEIDPVAGSLEEFYYDDDTGKCAVKRTWNVDEVCRYANDHHRASGIYDDYSGDSAHGMYRIANIDCYTMLALKRDHGIDIMKLSDPEMDRRFTKWLKDNPRHKVTSRAVGQYRRQI